MKICFDCQCNYEDLILAKQESETDECAHCPYKGVGICKSQCCETVEIINPVVMRELAKASVRR